MKQALFSLFFLAVIGIGIVLSIENEERSDADIKIAIVTPVTHPSLENIARGFIDTLPTSYRYKIYNAQGNPNLLRSELEDAASKDYDLVLTIGSKATQMGKEVFSKKNSRTPIVFTAVPHPEDLNIASKRITGVIESTRFAEQMQLLAMLKPDTKTILLVYDPSQTGLSKDRQEVEEILQTLGIKLMAVEVFKTNEIKQKIQPFLSQADVLLILKDNTVITALESLARLCEQYQVVLMTSDLDSPDHGAGLGFGVSEYDFGVEAAKKAQSILSEQELPPISGVTNFYLKINFAALANQGLILNSEDLTLPPYIEARAL